MADTPETTTVGEAKPEAGTPELGLNLIEIIQFFGKRSDLMLAFGVITILVVLILPLPTWMMDLGLAFSITFSVLILMTALFSEKSLEFNAFPTILLLATMTRLSLNLASTRLILADGHLGTGAAGKVIEAFGGFVMSGNFVIGIIVFAILVIVNFIVITKGSGRIAEVSARFTLDAMPGKQMAIDADLSTGLIDEETARARRKELEDESTFFGSMDGASKFVRGDAIAGLLITFINVIAGMIIGVAQKDLSFGQAAEFYTRLTVGDGLVTQIPALIVSTSAGLMVTKAGVRGSTEKALFSQLGGHPKAMGVSSLLLVIMAMLPGIPATPFLVLGSGTALMAFFVNRSQEHVKKEVSLKLEEEELEPSALEDEPISSALRIDYLRLELGYGLLSLINNPAEGQRLTDQIKALRRQMASDIGFVMPSVRIQDNMQLSANAYVVRLKEIEAGEGDLRPNMLLVMDPRGEEITLPGEKTVEPTFGLPAMWIDETNREEALFRGYTVVDPATVITTHLTEVIKDNMAELLSYAETQKLIDELDKEHQKLIADMIPAQISLGSVQRVLQNLLAERVSIRDLPTILEGVSEACGQTRNITMITEHVRARLARQISSMNTNDNGVITMMTLTPEWEQAFAESIVGTGEDRQLSMPPSRLQEFITALRTAFERQAMMGETPVLLTSPTIRPFVRSIVERFRPMTTVMSQNEVFSKASIKTLGQV
ncbi:MAG: flagellar biosynthesis protein FlhA [Rhodospirillaceae bacterium]|jgi:flagellar biosynthesis protein FlhA|nr:flagellar biosynthesis protein FlhA [Rhodospirillaceae bacterium]MBT5244387.1 flagellar biosynthesis protein FlhA [Rhodospirillaceae bacterium]MBT5563031.1 flagellar biosynthesis protein FlhA [Rhodospirillaceae bacterium]MBT6241770.1 flagellar biosynthesis protein FlhA [Rhodospirillaceae bacterium]MBT7137646.1 flagellar biosynthesis protein FlhA [Rhodospirillaceae bacterium]